jgi:hypothetical protein
VIEQVRQDGPVAYAVERVRQVPPAACAPGRHPDAGLEPQGLVDSLRQRALRGAGDPERRVDLAAS